MQERTALEDQLTAIGRIEQELADQLTMIELGEAEKDQKAITDAEEALKTLKAEVARRELEALLSGEAERRRHLSRGSCRRGRHRERGLGRTCCCACIRAGPSSTATRSSISKRRRARKPASSRRPSRSRAAMPIGWLKAENGVHRLVRISPSIPTRGATRPSRASTSIR